MSNLEAQLLNEHQAARLLGLSVFTLRAHRRRKTGPAYSKLGDAVRYALDDIEHFIEQGRVVPENSKPTLGVTNA